MLHLLQGSFRTWHYFTNGHGAEKALSVGHWTVVNQTQLRVAIVVPVVVSALY